MSTSKGRKRKAVAPASVPHREWLLEWLKDPENAAGYIEVSLEENDAAGLMQALRNIADAQGGIAQLAQKTGLNREQLYRTLSERGNPELRSLVKILSASGLRLEVTPKEQPQGSRRGGGAASGSRTSKGAKTVSRARVPTPA